MQITVNDIESSLAAYDIDVHVRPTHEVFPKRELDINHYSVVCSTQQEQYRVYHWLQFARPLFKGFDAWAVLITAIESDGSLT